MKVVYFGPSLLAAVPSRKESRASALVDQNDPARDGASEQETKGCSPIPNVSNVGGSYMSRGAVTVLYGTCETEFYVIHMCIISVY